MVTCRAPTRLSDNAGFGADADALMAKMGEDSLVREGRKRVFLPQARDVKKKLCVKVTL